MHPGFASFSLTFNNTLTWHWKHHKDILARPKVLFHYLQSQNHIYKKNHHSPLKLKQNPFLMLYYKVMCHISLTDWGTTQNFYLYFTVHRIWTPKLPCRSEALVPDYVFCRLHFPSLVLMKDNLLLFLLLVGWSVFVLFCFCLFLFVLLFKQQDEACSWACLPFVKCRTYPSSLPQILAFSFPS